jgi:hypothetical protein
MNAGQHAVDCSLPGGTLVELAELLVQSRDG